MSMRKRIMSSLMTLGLFFFMLYGYSSNIKAESPSAVAIDEEKLPLISTYHPRIDGYWVQYYPLTTSLRKNVVISDVITPSSKWENWEGEKALIHSMNDENAENYDDSHNHYQNLLSEVLNFSEGTNAVAIWGDSSAVINGSKAWGGFFSARSNIHEFMGDSPFTEYVPKDVTIEYDKNTYDTQLIGVEVDVLNEGLPGVYPNMSKTGVQIVGFGNPNSMAVEVRSEDTDKNIEDENRRGTFESGIYFKNSIAPYGRVIVTDFEKARIGLDMNNTLFTEGAVKIKSNQVGTGILLNDGQSGEIYGGSRWGDDKEQWTTIRIGQEGFRIVSNDNTKELLTIDNYGGIYLNGDVYYNGELLRKSENSENSINIIRSEGEKTGISFNDYSSGEIYAEDDYVTIKNGINGFKIVSIGNKELIRVGNRGCIYWRGINIAYIVFVIAFIVLIIYIKMSIKIRRLTKDVKELKLLINGPNNA